jgi:hypothetical protein
MLKVITSTKKLRNLLEFVNHSKLGQRHFIEELEYKTPTHTKKRPRARTRGSRQSTTTKHFAMDHLHYRLNFDLDKNFITAWKSITKLVIFQSFVAKCCKMRIIIIALRNLPFFSHFVLRTGNWQPNRVLGHQFRVCNLKWLKIANFARIYYPHFTTFHNETLEYY